ncbi:hypothetical protein I0P70_12975 [Pontibacter sp. FD36]|uniref:hypothetical protein n=1 Tax=Pontibacter sp. FD36 TaxID=2789860 RepID=UPI001A10EF67|nr:hypothetical protein [Pontibacter sp. FD36]MBF8964161.1 hypothetical protein [Pontibacter sp. FD36]
MNMSVITNTTYKIILLVWVTINSLAGLIMLAIDFDLITLASFLVNAYILFCYFTKSVHLKQAVKVGTIVLLAASLLALFPAIMLGLLYGMGMIWAFIPLLIVMPLAGFYLYRGCTKYIQLVEIDEKTLEV